jgi:hypothetical protein
MQPDTSGDLPGQRVKAAADDGADAIEDQIRKADPGSKPLR